MSAGRRILRRPQAAAQRQDVRQTPLYGRNSVVAPLWVGYPGRLAALPTLEKGFAMSQNGPFEDLGNETVVTLPCAGCNEHHDRSEYTDESQVDVGGVLQRQYRAPCGHVGPMNWEISEDFSHSTLDPQ
jgi:hypothetical protein